MSLTPSVDRPEDRASQQPAAEPFPKDTRQTLPSLKETLGTEINAKRPIAPQPAPIPEFYIPGQSELYLEGLRIRTYRIGKNYFNMQEVPNETTNEFSRTTVDHRRITYTLNVVQQPEKARACGSGTKSSNDRRPVDPPPVVELKIYTNGVDTTMTYDATFMLYASLEHRYSRPVAQGKKYVPTTPPVLAGVTVASAAYLEKPKRAAYFIFPDLSVRHENWYRIRFSLFEGVKNDLDSDLGKPLNRGTGIDNPNTPVRHEGLFNRMEVCSTPFQVYSAKKFPGLDQSTDLSVLVADQGCRVRIRRDVRQRKPRRQKSGAEGEDAPSSYQGTPQATYRTLDHSRSASRNSLGSQYDRRESIDSHYSRPPFPSRQMSASSMPMTSPLMLTPTSSMPPPPPFNQNPFRVSFDNAPRPAPPSVASRPGPPMALSSPSILRGAPGSDMEVISHGIRLPPLANFDGGKSGPMYPIQAPTATKRSYTPDIRSDHKPLKGGAREDSLFIPPRTAPAPGGNDIIEADPDCDADEAEDRRLENDAGYLDREGIWRVVGRYAK